MRVALLSSDVGEPANDNLERLARAFADAGWEVAWLTHETLALTPRGVSACGLDGGTVALDGFDLVWLLGFGRRETFLDRMHLLRLVPQDRFVNTVDALVLLHGKLGLPEFQPETYASTEPAPLLRRIASGGRWVVKPMAGSFGRDVVRVEGNGPHTEGVVQRLTAHGGYCVLQRYVPDAPTREKRVIVAGDRIIGAYAKTGNVAAGAVPRPAELSRKERELALRVVARLNAQGARFAGLDLAWPYVFEANIANPGGLATLEALTGVDPTPRVVEAVTLVG
ncbi:MAG: hypothetical protein OXM56_02925 [Gammaproteobacteria bacterium]|nr:hypothetical protein [Gammaproteobacteria bacterium]